MGPPLGIESREPRIVGWMSHHPVGDGIRRFDRAGFDLRCAVAAHAPGDIDPIPGHPRTPRCAALSPPSPERTGAPSTGGCTPPPPALASARTRMPRRPQHAPPRLASQCFCNRVQLQVGSDPKLSTLNKWRSALEAAEVEFIHDDDGTGA